MYIRISCLECLTISSDEEEEGKMKKLESSNNSTCSHDTSNNFNEDLDTILEKEPVITNNSISSTSSDYAMETENLVRGICSLKLCIKTQRINMNIFQIIVLKLCTLV